MITTFKKLEVVENSRNLLKAFVRTLVNGTRLDAFPEDRQSMDCQLLLLLVNLVLKLWTSNQKGKEIKGIRRGKEEVKLCIFTYHIFW